MRVGFYLGGRHQWAASMIDHPKVQPEPMSGCWLWSGAIGENGHGVIRQRQKNDYTHRLSWLLERGEIPDGLWVLHRCNNACCCNPDHLYLGDHSDNMRDMKKSGRRRGKLIGESSPVSVLTERDVLAIRAARASGVSGWALGKQYGIARQHVYEIEARKIWRHI